MYVITTSPTFKQKVTFPYLNEQGTEIKRQYVAIFKRPTLSELNQLVKDVSEVDAETGTVRLPDEELLKRWQVGWEGIRTLDEDNKEVPLEFSVEAMLENFEQNPMCRPATVVAFFDGAKGAKAKN
jgi:hypothetical protein